MPATPPWTLTAARVLLWVMSFLLALTAVEVFLLIGGAYGAGVATMQLVPALVCVLAAKRLPRMGRVGYALLLAFLAFVALWQVNRFTGGEPVGIVGAAFNARPAGPPSVPA